MPPVKCSTCGELKPAPASKCTTCPAKESPKSTPKRTGDGRPVRLTPVTKEGGVVLPLVPGPLVPVPLVPVPLVPATGGFQGNNDGSPAKKPRTASQEKPGHAKSDRREASDDIVQTSDEILVDNAIRKCLEIMNTATSANMEHREKIEIELTEAKSEHTHTMATISSINSEPTTSPDLVHLASPVGIAKYTYLQYLEKTAGANNQKQAALTEELEYLSKMFECAEKFRNELYDSCGPPQTGQAS